MSRNLDELCLKHYNNVSPSILSRLRFLSNGSKSGLHKKTIDSLVIARKSVNQDQKRDLKFVLKYLLFTNGNGKYPNLEFIITCKPEFFTGLFMFLNKVLLNLYGSSRIIQNHIVGIKPILEKVFNYDVFAGKGILVRKGEYYSALQLLNLLSFNVCPYCNRNYINSINGYRADLDHFYPKHIYPIFGLSFYNLIPSCTFCNRSVKGTKDFNTEDYIHPYHQEFGSGAKFKYKINSQSEFNCTELKITTPNSLKGKKIDNSIKAFELNAVYDSHKDIAMDIHQKYLEDNDDYYKSLSGLASILNLDEASFYQYYFGNYMKENDFEKRPLAKFTYDLVDELGILDKFSL